MTGTTALSPEFVREVFKGLETGDGAHFFQHVASDVDWTVMGTRTQVPGHRQERHALRQPLLLGCVLS